MKRFVFAAAISLACLTQTVGQTVFPLPSTGAIMKSRDTFRASDYNALLALKQDYPVPLFSASVKGIVNPSGGGTSNFLRADNTWAIPQVTASSGGFINTDGSISAEGASSQFKINTRPTASQAGAIYSGGTGVQFFINSFGGDVLTLTSGGNAQVASGALLGSVGHGGFSQLFGATSGSRSMAVDATATKFTFGGGALTVPEGGTGDTGTAWTSYSGTAAPTCGNAAIAVNSARSKTLGKTTFIEFEFTISATIGTCAGTLTFTLPVNSNSTTLAPFYETNGGVMGGCRTVGAGSVMSCLKIGGAVFLANEHLVMSGVYENQ